MFKELRESTAGKADSECSPKLQDSLVPPGNKKRPVYPEGMVYKLGWEVQSSQALQDV